MGMPASASGKPAGWCACGPRSRYTGADGERSRILRGARDPAEDDTVWLSPRSSSSGPTSGAGASRAR